MYGYKNTHAGALNDATFLELFNMILADSLANPQRQ